MRTHAQRTRNDTHGWVTPVGQPSNTRLPDGRHANSRATEITAESGRTAIQSSHRCGRRLASRRPPRGPRPHPDRRCHHQGAACNGPLSQPARHGLGPPLRVKSRPRPRRAAQARGPATPSPRSRDHQRRPPAAARGARVGTAHGGPTPKELAELAAAALPHQHPRSRRSHHRGPPAPPHASPRTRSAVLRRATRSQPQARACPGARPRRWTRSQNRQRPRQLCPLGRRHLSSSASPPQMEGAQHMRM